jgi:hypothetical protein
VKPNEIADPNKITPYERKAHQHMSKENGPARRSTFRKGDEYDLLQVAKSDK